MSTIDTLPPGWTWEGQDAIRRPDGEAARIDWERGTVRIHRIVATLARRPGSVPSAYRRRLIDTAVRLLLAYPGGAA